MQSEAQILMGVSRSTESGADAGSRTEKKDNSAAASAFLELFSGSLAQSYENDAISSRRTSAAEHIKEASSENRTEKIESERRASRYDNDRFEKVERNDQRSETRVQRDDATDRSSRNENSRSRTEASDRQTSQTRNDSTSETNRKQETDKTESHHKVEKNEANSENLATDGKRAARSNAQARAVANLMNGATKAEADESVSKQVEQLLKSTSKVSNQAQATRAETGVNISKSEAPEAAAAAKNAAVAKGAENSAKAVEVNTNRANAVQAAEAPKQSENAQTGGNQQQSAGNNMQSGVNAAAVNQEAVRLAAQHNRGFAAVMKEAGQNNGVSKAGAASAANGSQVAMNTAASQYSRAATHVFNAPKAQAATQAQPSQVISQLIRAAKISMQNGREEMKILLKPEELGWLKVKITVEGNRVTAHFGAENEHVRSILEGNISQLQQALQNNNLKVNQIQIDVASQQHGQNQQSGAAGDTSNNGRNGSHLGSGKIDEDILEESMAEELYYLPDTAALELSAVDLRI